jgi:predicted XRE-type DNA-binding protein
LFRRDHPDFTQEVAPNEFTLPFRRFGSRLSRCEKRSVCFSGLYIQQTLFCARRRQTTGRRSLRDQLRFRGDAYRIVYAVLLDDDVWVIHAFKTPAHEMDLVHERLRRLKEMVVRGSGNVFRDFGRPNAELEQLRSILAARIIGVLDERGLSVRKAHEITGIAAADFSRIRRANLGRFTVDRLMTILARLDQQVQVRVTVRAKRHHARTLTRNLEGGRWPLAAQLPIRPLSCLDPPDQFWYEWMISPGFRHRIQRENRSMRRPRRAL